ncbi:hypothetical protein RRG08_023889, partial [Elysia crispata]
NKIRPVIRTLERMLMGVFNANIDKFGWSEVGRNVDRWLPVELRRRRLKKNAWFVGDVSGMVRLVFNSARIMWL